MGFLRGTEGPVGMKVRVIKVPKFLRPVVRVILGVFGQKV